MTVAIDVNTSIGWYGLNNQCPMTTAQTKEIAPPN